MADWQPDEWGLQDIDDAGDDQYGKVYSIRYRVPQNADGTYSLITVGFYSQDHWQANGKPIERGDAALIDPPSAEERYSIGQQVEFMICRDPDDPGGTEEWCDYVYRSSWFAMAEPFTDGQIKSVMTHFDHSHGELIAWDGQDTSGAVLCSAVLPIDPQDWETYVLPPQLWKRIDDALNETENAINRRADADLL